LYLLLGDEIQGKIQSISNGATVHHLNMEDIRNLELPTLPLIQVQNKIASILSAYDDLIENNTRRIQLLEEMTQLIYREWFIHFRFPGHENVKMVDSPMGKIPEGWEIKKLLDISDVIDCLHSKKPVDIGHGGILLQVWNIENGGRLDMSKQYRINEEDYKLWTSRIEVIEGDCVVTNVGRIGAVAQIPKGMKAAIGRNMTAIRSKKGLLTPTFLIEYLLSPCMKNEIMLKKDSGTIMDSLNVKGIVKLCVICPPYYLMEKYESVCRPMRFRMELLIEQNNNLKSTRNLLLPKLIYGELDVSNLDIGRL
jgi:type I restriction enzyme S subunit